MALKVRFENPIEKHRFAANSIVYYPPDLVAYFKEKNTLEIAKGTYFYVWLKGESLEWANDSSINFNRMQAIFNKILQPLGKSMKFSLNPEKINLETFNDGFYIFSLESVIEIRLR